MVINLFLSNSMHPVSIFNNEVIYSIMVFAICCKSQSSLIDHTCGLRSLLLRFDETSDSGKLCCRSILIGLKTIKFPRSKKPRSSLVMHLKARCAQFSRRFDIFGLQFRSFQGHSFPNYWSRETKTLVQG